MTEPILADTNTVHGHLVEVAPAGDAAAIVIDPEVVEVVTVTPL